MSAPEPSYPMPERPEYSNASEAQEDDLKTNFMKMKAVLKEEMKKSLKEIEEKTNKKLDEINKSLNV